MNPFIVNGIIPEQWFCDRQKETDKITKTLLNGANILLTSQRRMGKTQLIRHIFEQKEIKENYYTFYTDIYATTSLSELVLYLSKEIYSRLVPFGKRTYDRFISILRSLNGSFSYDPISGVPAFNLKLGDILSPELTIEEIFTFLESADKPCLFAIDEFQRIGDYHNSNVEALLRTQIQKMTNCCFIFAGSNRHILENMFNSSSKPFYNSANQLFLDRIERETYVSFIKKGFAENGRQITDEAAYESYDLFSGHTYYVHSLLHDAFTYSNSNKPVTVGFLLSTLDNILEERAHSFADQMSLLSYQQKEVLIAVAKEGKASGVTSVGFTNKHSLTSPSSVQNALRTLLGKDIITYESQGKNKVYSLSDRYLELWIKRNY